MFSEPSDESAMCMAITFRASLRHFSLLTELKAQFNHDGVISRFGSLLSMRHSSISLNHFMASFLYAVVVLFIDVDVCEFLLQLWIFHNVRHPLGHLH
jgi:hypothetical protein